MRLRARGQAVVELSLLMIVIIPVIFYTLFLDDLLRHRLDLLESVLSSPFDYGAIDQQKSKGADLTHTEQLTWCDHTSLYNAHNKGADCDNSVHHKAFTAHVCWLVGDAQQVTCTNDKSQGDIDSNASDYNGGGMVTCSAKAGVLNYFIAQQIFGGAFTKKDKSAKMTSAETMSGDVHGHSGAASENVYMLEKQQFAVLHDVWSINTQGELNPLMPTSEDKGDPKVFTGRVNIYQEKFKKFDDADDFLKKAQDDKTISDDAGKDSSSSKGDDEKTLHLAYKTTPGSTFGVTTGHYSSAFSDSRVSGTYSARKNTYFGMDEDTSP